MAHNKLIDILNSQHSLTEDQWTTLLSSFTDEDLDYAMKLAQSIAVKNFGKKIYFRGIVEFTNICKKNCFYCGIRCGNKKVSRYRLTKDDILHCCDEGYACGFRTFVLQGGEDHYFTDERMCEIIRLIKDKYPDCAITLSIGERSRKSYEKMYEAGADRYLLRHETAEADHYGKLHPENLSLAERMRCLRDLKEIGYQTGCGCMVGSPHQTPRNLAKDMVFMSEFQPEMIGIGPFIPHQETPFRGFNSGSVRTSLFLLSLCRIMLPWVLLPSTTALGTVDGDGRKMGVLAGCNVIMPNLSPLSVRKKYMLYDNKVGTDLSAKQGVDALRQQMENIGYEVIVGKGDFRKEKIQ